MAHSTAHLNPYATSVSGGQVMGLKAHGLTAMLTLEAAHV